MPLNAPPSFPHPAESAKDEAEARVPRTPAVSARRERVLDVLRPQLTTHDVDRRVQVEGRPQDLDQTAQQEPKPPVELIPLF